jgi:hypothetical protein
MRSGLQHVPLRNIMPAPACICNLQLHACHGSKAMLAGEL